MSNPVLARKDDDDDRFYLWGGEAFWSVTTIIGGGVPKHLSAWAAKSVADLVYADLTGHGTNARSHAAIRRWARAGHRWIAERQAAGELKTIKLAKLTDTELALRWIKGAPDRLRDAAAALGTDVHDEAERLVLSLARETGEAWADGRPLPAWPDDLAGHMTAFARFLEEYRPRFLATEATVFNRPQAYAGTLDAVMTLPIGGVDRTVIVDYKSGNKVYPEVGMQLAAYSRAEFVASPDGITEVPMPAAEVGAVLHIRPTGCRLRLVRIDEPVYHAFLHAREVYRWAKEIAGTVLQQELAPIIEEVA